MSQMNAAYPVAGTTWMTGVVVLWLSLCTVEYNMSVERLFALNRPKYGLDMRRSIDCTPAGCGRSICG